MGSSPGRMQSGRRSQSVNTKSKGLKVSRIAPFTPVQTNLENGSVFLFSSNFFRKNEQMLQLSLQLEIKYALIYLIGEWQDTYAHGYSRVFGKIGSKCILPAVARKCYSVVGEQQNTHDSYKLFPGAETTYLSRIFSMLSHFSIDRPHKIPQGCAIFFCNFFMIC